MDIIFNCPKCEQELAVDSAGAGSEITCPSCGEKIIIPQPPAPPGSQPAGDGGHGLNPMSTSAAAKVEMHLKVPVHSTPGKSLIGKPLVPLEAAAKEPEKGVRIKSIRHSDCVEVGHDRFDETVSKFLAKVGEANIININCFNYQHLDIGSQKLVTEYGVLIVFKD